MNDTPVNIPQVHAELNRLLHLAAKVEPLRAENRHLREIIARMPKPRTIYSRRVDAPIAACPFCGGTSTVYESGLRDGCLDGEPDAWTSAVTCCSCAAVGPWRKADTRADAEQRALAAWSSRLAGDFRRFYDEIHDAADQFHRDIGAEPGSVAPHVIIANASGYYLDREHLRTVERELRDVLSIDDDADIVDAVRRVVERDDLRAHAQRTADLAKRLQLHIVCDRCGTTWAEPGACPSCGDTYTAADLVRRAVHAAGRDRPSMVRWAHVKDIFGVGSGVSISICEACGADPHGHVGIEDEPDADREK